MAPRSLRERPTVGIAVLALAAIGTAFDLLIVADTVVHGEVLVNSGHGWTAAALDWLFGQAGLSGGAPSKIVLALATLGMVVVGVMGIPGTIFIVASPWIAAAWLSTRRAPRSSAR